MARLSPTAAGNSMASHVKGEKAAAWSLARMGAPLSTDGFHSGSSPLANSFATNSCHGSITTIGSLAITLDGACAPGSADQGKNAYSTSPVSSDLWPVRTGHHRITNTARAAIPIAIPALRRLGSFTRYTAARVLPSRKTALIFWR